MVGLHPHDLLVNIVAALTMPVSIPESPIGINGILKKDLNYEFQLKKFEDEYNTIFGNNFHPPDGFLKNTSKNISITVECKSFVDEEDINLETQLKFYSENKKFKEIFIEENEKNEILIVCFEEYFKKVLEIVKKNLELKTNIVVWAVRKTLEDNFFVYKKYGNHIDDELNRKMAVGVEVSPPTGLLLISPHISSPRLTAEIGKRLLINIALYSEIDIEEFITNQWSILVPSRRIKDAIRYLLILVPEFGKFNEDRSKIIFKKNPKINKIREKIEFISTLKKDQFQAFLRKKSLRKEDIEKIKKLPKDQKTITSWL